MSSLASEADLSKVLSELGLDDDEEDVDLIKLLLEPDDYLEGCASVEWQECGVLHTLWDTKIHETRTFAFDDFILGNKTKCICRIKDFVSCDEKLKLGVRELDFDTSGVGFRVWDAAVILTVWLYRHKELFAGKRVVEIGAGCGLAGMLTLEYADSVVLSDIEDALLDNLLTSVVMNHGNEVIWEYFPSKLTIPEASVEATALLNPQVSAVCEDGAKVSICKLDYDKVIAVGNKLEYPFDFVCGSDLTYSPDLGETVAKVSHAILAPFGEAVIVSPEERVGNIECIVQFMKLGKVLSMEWVKHKREMTPLDSATRILGRPPKDCHKSHLIIHWMKFDSKYAIEGRKEAKEGV